MRDLDRRRNRARAGATSAKAQRTRTYPLRAVVTVAYTEVIAKAGGPFEADVTVLSVLLECGHLLRPARDMIGERHPVQRRCGKCAAGKPPDVDADGVAAASE